MVDHAARKELNRIIDDYDLLEKAGQLQAFYQDSGNPGQAQDPDIINSIPAQHSEGLWDSKVNFFLNF